jgi:broad specificity phosphatase PhoE
MPSTRFTRRFHLVLRAILLAAPVVASAQPSTVILVRHAERDTAPRQDPVLTAAGRQRALDLAAALADAGVRSVITTQYQRTQLTAKPIMDALRLTPIVVSASGPTSAHIDAVAMAVRARPEGDIVLVVGHSNTIPGIVGALGGPKLPDLCDGQYSMMYILHYSPTAAPGPRVVQAKYGVADATDSANCPRMSR